MDGIVFNAIFSKATTLIDNSWRISFDVNNDQAQEILKIATLNDENLIITVMTEDQVHNHG